MLTYEDLKDKPKTLLAMTSLTRAEFDALLVPFAAAWETATGASRKDNPHNLTILLGYES